MRLKKFFKSVAHAVASLYTSGKATSYIAIAVTTIIVLFTATVASIAIISKVTSAEEISTTTGETSISDIADTTTEPITIEPPTTTVPPGTTTPVETDAETETEATTVQETTTVPETTTPPETIAIEDISIGDPEDSDEIFVDKSALENEFNEPETPEPTTKPIATTAPSTKPVATSKPTQQTTTSKPVKEEITTEPATKPPVSEYACVVKGIDISKWNSQGKAAIDWSKVKKSGVEYVIIRVGNRSISSTNIYEDPYFKTHIEGALSAGLQVGVYFYSQAITEKEALEEASFVLSLIKNYKITYPVVFDWEPASGTRVRNANLSKAQATAIAKKFLSTMEGYGYEAMLYSYHSAIKSYFDTAQLSHYKTWVAWYFNKYNNTGVQYQVGDPLPETNYPYQMWQYSSTGKVPGISGNVDLNVSFFSYTGSGVPSSAIVLNLPATSYTSNKGISVDFKTGVKAFNTAGLDVSSSVTTTVADSEGNLISEEHIFDTPGVYTITYSIKDFTGVSKSAIAKLTVRDNPSLQLAEKELTFNRQTSTYENILEAVKNNLLSVTDYEGNSLNLSTVTITGLEGCYSGGASEETTAGETTAGETSQIESSETADSEATSSETTSIEAISENATTTGSNGLIVGTYNVTYTVTDGKGAMGTETIVVNIIDEEETTTELESSSEKSTSLEETTSSDKTTSISTETT